MKKKVLFAILGAVIILLSVFAVIYFICNASRPADPVQEAMKRIVIYTDEGFQLELSDDGSYYTLEIKTVLEETDLVIPAYYNGIPIKKFFPMPEALTNVETLSIPETVEQITIYRGNIDNLKLNEFQNGYYLGIEGNPFYALIYYSYENGSQAVLHRDTKIINGNAFNKCKNVISIALPEGLRSIGSGAFSQCSSLTHIEIPDSVTFVGSSVFKNCDNLESAVLGLGITEITNSMFNHCSSLKTIDIKGKVTAIRDHAFNGCSSLNSFEIPRSVTEIGSCAFVSTALENVTLHKGIRNISFYAFHETNETLNYNEYRNGLYLGDNQNPYMYLINIAAEEPSELVIHPDTYFVVPMLVSKIKSLKSLSVEGDEGRYLRSEGNCIIRKEDKTLLCGIGTSVIPSKGVKEIFEYAFFESDIESVVIPDSVKKIGYGAFGKCQALSSVEIGRNVREMGDSAFSQCIKLERISLPESLIEIPDYCFSECFLLSEISITEKTEIVGHSAFSRCIALQSISLPGVKVIHNNAFISCDILEKVNLSSELVFIGDNAFQDLDMLKGIILPYGIRHIGSEAFAYCNSLKYVNIPKSIESFGTRVYMGCTSLESAIVPEGAKELAVIEFEQCSSLKKIFLPSTLKKINVDAVYRCDTIEQIVYNGTVEQWNAIEKSESWYRDVPTFRVICTDGEVELPANESDYVGSW